MTIIQYQSVTMDYILNGDLTKSISSQVNKWQWCTIDHKRQNLSKLLYVTEH